MVIILALALVTISGPEDQHIAVNPAEVSSVRVPRDLDHFVKGTRCVVIMANGNIIASPEECSDIRLKLGAGPPPVRPESIQ